MPLAGGISPPIISLLGRTQSAAVYNTIDTESYVKIETENPDTVIFFTTNGDSPDIWKRKINGNEITHRYKGPFCLKEGKRIIKALAVNKFTKAESNVIVRTFDVRKYQPFSGSNSPDNASVFSEDLDFESYSRSNGKSLQPISYEEVLPDEDVPSIPEHGFSARNNSGTQINVWGSIPGMGWDVKTPDQNSIHSHFAQPSNFYNQSPVLPSNTYQNGFYNPPQSLVKMQPLIQEPFSIENHEISRIVDTLNKKIDISQRDVLLEVRTMLGQIMQQTMQKMNQLQQTVTTRPPSPSLKQRRGSEMDANSLNNFLPVAPGKGNLKMQLNHIHGHLLQFVKNDPDLSAEIGSARMGRVVGAELEESEDGFLLSVHFDKPSKSKLLERISQGVKSAAPKRPVSASPSKSSRSVPSTPAKSSKPVENNKNQEVETEIRRPRFQKAPTMELKTEDKPPEQIQSSYFETEEYVQEGTLKPCANFDCKADCEALRKAMKGLGTDEKTIIEIMGKRSLTQRLEIVKTFKTMYGKDLVKEFKSEISGNFFRVIEGLCWEPDEYDSHELHRAMKGLGTDEDALIEILCTRTNKQIETLKNRYKLS